MKKVFIINLGVVFFILISFELVANFFKLSNLRGIEKGLIDTNHPIHKMIPGSSGVHFGKRIFIDKYLPAFSKKLHYRIVDVSSWKAIFQLFMDIRYQKNESHRAMGDIEESLRELKMYLSYFDREKLPQILDLNL